MQPATRHDLNEAFGRIQIRKVKPLQKMVGMASTVALSALLFAQLGGQLLDIPSVGEDQILILKTMTVFFAGMSLLSWLQIEQ